MSREDKIQKLFEFAMSVRGDPDFHRLVFPPAVLAKLAEAGFPVVPKEYSVSDAVEKCFSAKTTEVYTNSTIEMIDQSKMEIAFPAIPPVEPLPLLEEANETEETKTDVFTVVEEPAVSNEPTLHVKEVSPATEHSVASGAAPAPSGGPGVP